MTPTARATCRRDGLVHHCLVQPAGEDAQQCDLMVACGGYVMNALSRTLGPWDAVVTCLRCACCDWEETVAAVDRRGQLTRPEDVHAEPFLSRILATA